MDVNTLEITMTELIEQLKQFKVELQILNRNLEIYNSMLRK